MSSARPNSVFVNGQLVPPETATVSIFDRGFLYGDGLFETVRVANGTPVRWDAHWTRLSRGAEFLRIGLGDGLRKHADALIEANAASESVLRIQLTRGVGPRGYSPREAKSPLLIMSTHPLPPIPQAWKLASSSCRLPPANPLSPFKTTNKLLHILAKAAAEAAGADEGLLLSDSGHLAQGSSSNLFWIKDQIIYTAPDDAGILPGTTRAAVLAGLDVRQTTIRPEALERADGVFMTLSTFGVVEVASLDGKELPRSPLTQLASRVVGV